MTSVVVKKLTTLVALLSSDPISLIFFLEIIMVGFVMRLLLVYLLFLPKYSVANNIENACPSYESDQENNIYGFCPLTNPMKDTHIRVLAMEVRIYNLQNA